MMCFAFTLLDFLEVELFTIGGFFFFQAEDGIRDLVRSRGLGDVYKRQLIFRYLKEQCCRLNLIKAVIFLHPIFPQTPDWHLSLIHI